MGNFKHLGLFEGIGGFSLAARWMSWETVAWCEWDKNCQRVLKYHFPNAIPHDDITKTDFTRYAGQIDILTGGFPCQPFSTAGKRLGSADDRHLWPETLRAIKEISPGVCVFENVFGLTSILEQACETDVEIKAVQLFSQGDNSQEVGERIREVKQRTISIIINDLQEAGYNLPETSTGEPVVLCVPACAVDAPHRRDRVWFVAYSNKGRNKESKLQHTGVYTGSGWHNEQITQNPDEIRRDSEQPESQPGERQKWQFGAGNDVWVSDAANAKETRGETLRIRNEAAQSVNGVFGCNGPASNASKKQLKDGAKINRGWPDEAENGTGLYDRASRLGDNWPASNANKIERPERWMHPDRPGEAERHTGTRDSRDSWPTWQHFPTQSPVCSRNDGVPGGLDGITFSKWREFSIGAYGNAIVPQVAYQIFKAVEQWEISKAGQPTK